MAHMAKGKKKVIARISRIRGQLNAVERGLIEERECYEVLQTVAACRGAMDSLMAEILEEHIRFHLLEPGAGKSRERRRAAVEVIEIVNAFLR